MGAEVPVWVSGLQKWVTGITKKTTCEDIVQALLKTEPSLAAQMEDDDDDAAHDRRHNYVIVERWRRVERPLDGRARILKVWRTWGEEQPHVRLTLRHLEKRHDTTNTLRRPHYHQSDNKPQRAKLGAQVQRQSGNGGYRAWRASQCKDTQTKKASIALHTHSGKRLRPRKKVVASSGCETSCDGDDDWEDEDVELERKRKGHHHHHHREDDRDRRVTKTMERMMKMILAQGETIQAQLRRLREKDDQIDIFEQKMHELRLEEVGANYVLDSYLGEPSPTTVDVKSEENEGEPPDPQELQRCVRYYERTLDVSERLEREERHILSLSAELREAQNGEAETRCGELDEFVSEVERASAITAANAAEIHENELALGDLQRHCDSRRRQAQRLERDLSAAEQETERLRAQWRALMVQKQVLIPAPSPPPLPPPISSNPIKDVQDNDSNSDTGLSSLHSSGDEALYVLDTLV